MQTSEPYIKDAKRLFQERDFDFGMVRQHILTASVALHDHANVVIKHLEMPFGMFERSLCQGVQTKNRRTLCYSVPFSLNAQQCAVVYGWASFRQLLCDHVNKQGAMPTDT